MKYIDAEKLTAEIERRRKQRIEANDKIAKGEIFTDTEDEFNSSLARYGNRLVYQELFEIICFIEFLQQEQPDTCIFGNTPSESSCKFCGVECALREPKQTGTTSAGLSSKDEAVGLAIMAYLDTKVKHDNAKVCGVSLKVAREWIREKIANKQEQTEVDLEKAYKSYMKSRKDDLSGNAVTLNMKDLARHFYDLGQCTKYQQDRAEFAKLKAKEWQDGYDEGYAKGLNARKEE